MRILCTFGINEDGQCGFDNNEENSQIKFPTIVQFPSTVIISSVSTGSRHTLALSNNGLVFSWGWGKLGQLGHGIELSCSAPTQIQHLAGISAISAGGMHSGCIDFNKNCYTWGSFKYGQLGLGKIDNNVCSPTVVTWPVNFDSEFKNSDCSKFLVSKISCGGMHTAVIDINGFAYSWGRSDSGQTGFSDWYLDFSPGLFHPKLVTGYDNKAIDVACGGFHTLILTNNGNVYAMGKEDFGLLGIGTLKEWRMKIGAESPTLITSLIDHNITAISAGGWHSCFLSSGGKLFTCGKGEYGRLGLSDEKSRPLPTEVNIFHPTEEVVPVVFKTVSAGGSHTIFTTTTGDVYSVGRVDGGRLGMGQINTDRFSTPQCITSHLIHSLKTISNSENMNCEVIQVSAGGSHSSVLIEVSEFIRPCDESETTTVATKKTKYTF